MKIEHYHPIFNLSTFSEPLAYRTDLDNCEFPEKKKCIHFEQASSSASSSSLLKIRELKQRRRRRRGRRRGRRLVQNEFIFCWLNSRFSRSVRYADGSKNVPRLNMP